jgi:hypothetical protein
METQNTVHDTEQDWDDWWDYYFEDEEDEDINQTQNE